MDNIISLGSDCSVDYNIRRLFPSKSITGPLSWASFSLDKLLTVLAEKFDETKYIDSLTIKKFSSKHPVIKNGANAEESSGSFILKNDYGLNFAHEILQKYELDTFKTILKRRIARFYDLTQKNKITFIRFENKQVKNIASYIAKILLLNKLLIENGFSNFDLILITPFHLEAVDQLPDNVRYHYYDNSRFVNWKQEEIYDSIFN